MVKLGDLLVAIGADPDEFNKAMEDVEEKVGETSSRIEKVGKSLTETGKTLTVGVTLPILALGTAAVASADTHNKAMNRIRASTGAAGDTLLALEADYFALSKSVPSTTEEIAAAIVEVHRRTGAVGEPLRTMATQLLNLARLTGTEVTPLVVDSARAFKVWGVAAEEQSALLDSLFVTSQRAGIPIASLLATLVESAPVFKALGFDIGQSAALLGEWQLAGLNADRMLAGLRTGLGDIAGQSAAAMEKMGALNQELAGLRDTTPETEQEAAKLTAAIAEKEAALAELTEQLDEAASKGAEGIFRELLDAIKTAPNDLDAAAKSTEVFGARAGPELAANIRAGAFELGEVAPTAETAAGAINRTSEETGDLGESMQLLQNQVTTALQPLGVELLQALKDVMPVIQAVVGVVAGLAAGFAGLPPDMKAVIINVTAVAAAIGPLLVLIGSFVGAISGIGGALGLPFLAVLGPVAIAIGAIIGVVAVATLLHRHWEEVTAALQGAWDTIVRAFTGAVEFIVGLFTSPWNPLGIASMLIEKWDEVRAALDTAWQKLKGIFEGGASAVTGAVQGILTFIQGLGQQFYEAGANIVQNIINGIGSLIGDVSKTVGKVAEKIRAFFPFSPAEEGPLRELPDWGALFEPGLEHAITGANRLFGDLAPAFPTAAPTGATHASGGFVIEGGIHVTVTVQGTDGRNVSDEVRDGVLNALEQKWSSLRTV